MSNKKEVIVRYYPDGRVYYETKGLKGTECREVTKASFDKLSAGRGTSQDTAERFQGGDGSKRTLRQG